MHNQDKEYILNRISILLDTEGFRTRTENGEMVAFSIGKFYDDFEQSFDEAIQEYINYKKSYDA